MEEAKMQAFEEYIRQQCYFAIRAFRDLEASVIAGGRSEVFYHAQMMLLAHATISKLLWAQGEGKARDERSTLRLRLGATNSFLQTERKMRNHLEHLDERLDQWWDESGQKKVDSLVISIRFFDEVLPMFSEKERFRHYDPETKILRFWSDELKVDELIADITRLRDSIERIQESLRRPRAEVQSPNADGALTPPSPPANPLS